jgi:hypothetical protein
MDGLFSYLDRQIAVFRQAVAMVDELPGLEKPAANLKDTLYQLEHLRGSGTWEEIIARKNIDYGRLVFPKKADVPEVTEPVKAARNACKKGLDKKRTRFTDTNGQILQDAEKSDPRKNHQQQPFDILFIPLHRVPTFFQIQVVCFSICRGGTGR